MIWTEGLSVEELAFHEALAHNQSAVEAMGKAQLRLIAHELLEQVRKNATVDWHIKETARARMRLFVKRILKKNSAIRLTSLPMLSRPCWNRQKYCCVKWQCKMYCG